MMSLKKIEKFEDHLEKYQFYEGLVKAQIATSVSELMALTLKKYKTAKEMWEELITEITKKLKIVLTNLQRQLCNIKCSEEDDLCEHLDKAQDLYVYLKEMGATIRDEEFMDIILSSLPPSYETLMNSLTTSLEECKQLIKSNNIIRVLKSQYDR
jgi:chromosome condensin MukBEF ATPase and DNA-binding subunit MukB